MHLLVLSAFRRSSSSPVSSGISSLNAPFGAQCFPTLETPCSPSNRNRSLNAPFGAQCFPTHLGEKIVVRDIIRSQCTFWCSVLSDSATTPTSIRLQVSMHLLVLSAFRLEKFNAEIRKDVSQCTFWCSVLSDIGSSTFDTLFPVSMHLLVLSAFRLESSVIKSPHS